MGCNGIRDQIHDSYLCVTVCACMLRSYIDNLCQPISMSIVILTWNFRDNFFFSFYANTKYCVIV